MVKRFAVLAALGAALALAVPAAASVAPSQAQSPNWAGYVATGGFRSVTATYRVPAVRCSVAPRTGAYHWAGLDGWTDSVVEQAGIATYCDAFTDQPVYSAWTGMYPAAESFAFYVKPGDTVTSSVAYRPKTRVFVLTVTDPTIKATRTRYARCKTTCPRSSAEVITEEAWGPADFGHITFAGVHVTSASGRAGTLNSGPWKLTEVTENYTGTQVNDQPGPLSAGGTAFTNTWVSSFGSPPGN